MLNLKCKIDNLTMDLGQETLDNIRFDLPKKSCPYIFNIKRFNRMVSSNYKFCNISFTEKQVKELINKNLNA